MSSRFLILVLLVLAAIAGWLWYERQQPDEELELAPIDLPEPAPVIRHPLPPPDPPPIADMDDVDEEPEVEPEPPLPMLADSDPYMLERLGELLGEDFVTQWLVDSLVIERIVVLVNSLDGDAIQLRLRPLAPVPGEPLVNEDNDALYWNPINAERYQPLIDQLSTTDPATAASFYVRHYPLFQQAHEELAHPVAYFNDRLVDVIDHLLDTPEASPMFELERYEAHFRFADDSLQDQSWGRKSMMRLGTEQRREVIAWLREFQQRIASR